MSDEMQKIRWSLTIGLAGCRREGEIEIEAAASDDEIEESVMDAVHELLEIGWEKSQ